jgi:hypothetical protein
VTNKPKKRGAQKGAGRPKGSPNKITKDVKGMILGALNELGGQAWLVATARKSPKAFMQLIGKIVPRDISLEHGVSDDLADQLVKAWERFDANS